MKNQKHLATAGMIASVCLTVAFATGFFAAPAPTTVDFEATVSGVREVPTGSPMPGIHLDAKVNNRTTDIYLAPASFLADCGVSFSKGDVVDVTGTVSKSGDGDLVLAREVTSGRTTLYLRGEKGEPLWPEAKK